MVLKNQEVISFGADYKIVNEFVLNTIVEPEDVIIVMNDLPINYTYSGIVISDDDDDDGFFTSFRTVEEFKRHYGIRPLPVSTDKFAFRVYSGRNNDNLFTVCFKIGTDEVSLASFDPGNDGSQFIKNIEKILDGIKRV